MKEAHMDMTDGLLVKYLLDEATEAEQLQVAQWIAASDTHKKHFDDFRMIWAESRRTASAADTDAAWQKFRQRTQQAAMPAKAAQSRRWYGWVKVAAMLLLFAGVCYASGSYFFGGGSTVSKPPHAAIAVAPPPLKPAPAPAAAVTVQPTPAIARAATTAPVLQSPAAARQQHSLGRKLATAIGREQTLHRYYKTKEFICNGVPCPTEICVAGKIKCQSEPTPVVSKGTIIVNGQARAVYVSFVKINENPASNMEEIRAGTVSNDKNVIFNANSAPSYCKEKDNELAIANKNSRN